jgi:hypothetical protein
VQRVETRSAKGSGHLLGGGLVLIGLLVASAFLFLGNTSDVIPAIVVGTIMIGISLPILAAQSRRESDDRLFGFLVLALVAKLLGAVGRFYVAFTVYGGVADATGYNGWGVRLFQQFRQLNFHTDLHPLTGTHFIEYFTGLVYAVIGPHKLAGFLVFSWLGFWGLFLFYRAFTIAVPEGRRRSYARLVFFLPSLVYWPSSEGKEAWMMFALGIAGFGAARILSGRTVEGLVTAGIGLWTMGLIRPHVAGLVAVGLAAAFLIRKPREDLRPAGVFAKVVGLAAVLILAAVLVARTDQFLRNSSIQASPTQNLTGVLQGVSEKTAQGGSEFSPPLFNSPARAPLAIATVLFRPLIIEAHNAQTVAAALEATFLLLLTFRRRRWLVAAFKSARRQPFVAFAIAYTAVFIVAFSGVANFGLLARERVQMLPLFLVLLCIPPATDDKAPGTATA